METGWVVVLVILGISILSFIMLGSVARVFSIISKDDDEVNAPTTIEDTLEKEQYKRELLGYSPIVKEPLRNKEQDDNFVKCIDMGPVATDPIPDYILKSIKEVK